MAQQYDPYHTEGIKPIVPGQAKEETAGFCENCGAPLKAGQPFCNSCGHKNTFVEEQPGAGEDRETAEGEYLDDEETNEEGEDYLDGGDEAGEAEETAGTDDGDEPAPGDDGEISSEDTPYARNLRRRQAEAKAAAEARLQEQEQLQERRQRQARELRENQQRYTAVPAPTHRGRGEAAHHGGEAPRERYLERQPRPNREIYRDYYEEYEKKKKQEKKSTPTQIILTVVIILLLIVFIGVTAFWFIHQAGSRNRGTGRKTTVAEAMKTQDEASTEAAQSARVTEKEQPQTQTESEAPENKPDVTTDYGEYTVTIPGRWTGKYGVEKGSDYVRFYHNASKLQGCGGTLFSVYRYTDTGYEELPNYTVLGEGNGAAFVFTEPTDAQFVESTQKEYSQMAADLVWIRQHIKVTAQGEGPTEAPETEPPTEAPVDEIIPEFTDELVVNPEGEDLEQPDNGSSGGGDILAGSSDHPLTDSELSGLSAEDAQMAINEIYARHGHVFQDPSLQAYFDSQPWYQRQDSMSAMSDMEWENITKLQGVVWGQ